MVYEPSQQPWSERPSNFSESFDTNPEQTQCITYIIFGVSGQVACQGVSALVRPSSYFNALWCLCTQRFISFSLKCQRVCKQSVL